MNKCKKSIYFIIMTGIALFFIIIALCFTKFDTTHFRVNYYNDTIKVNPMSIYNEGTYYYVHDKGSIYELSSENINQCLITDTDITGICFLDNSIYYIAHEKLFSYSIATKDIELLDAESGYKYISSDNKYIYALRYTNGDFTNYHLYKIGNKEKYEIINDDIDIDREIKISHDDSYSYVYSGKPYRNFCGVANENNNIIFRSNDQPNKNLLYYSENIIIVSDEDYENFLSYDKNGNFKNMVYIPEHYSYMPQNIFSDEKELYMLLQSQRGNLSIGYYNLPQSRHKSDAIVKYDVENGIFDFVYETSNKDERIIGYKNDFVICLNHNNLYSINKNTYKKESLAKVNVSNAIFEICGNKVFVWNNNKYYGTYDINSTS